MNIGDLLFRWCDDAENGQTTGQFPKRLSTRFFTGGMTIALGLALTAGSPAAQDWTELFPSGVTPPVRVYSSGVYSPGSNRMILFAGLNGAGFSGVQPSLNDVWVLENADGVGGAPSWIQLSPTGGAPAPRVIHSVIYDPETNRMTAFAGNLHWAYCGGTGNDTWVLSNADGTEAFTPTWTQLFPSGGPPSNRYNHSAVYDPTSNRMIVFGGSPACGDPNNEVWVLEDANGLGAPNWILLSPTGGPPPVSAGHVAVYDPANNRMVVFSGSLGSDVWVLEDANGLGTPHWVKLSPTGGPPTTIHGRGVYNLAANQMIVFGGMLAATGYHSNEVWVLNNANGLGGAPNWTQLAPAGGPPSERMGNTIVLNGGANRMTIFGGASNITGLAYNDAWVLNLGPDLEVAPAHIDFGDVPPFSTTDRIVTVQNVGADGHVVEEVSLSGIGASSFSVSPAIPTAVNLAPGGILDVTATYLPTGEGEETATLSIVSDEGTVEVSLVGNGLAGAVDDQITLLETNVNESIAEGTLIGSGSGGSSGGRLGAFANMVEAAGDLIEAGYVEDACGQLKSALKRVDGDPRPPDFVAGTDAELTEAEIVFLMQSLGCN